MDVVLHSPEHMKFPMLTPTDYVDMKKILHGMLIRSSTAMTSLSKKSSQLLLDKTVRHSVQKCT